MLAWFRLQHIMRSTVTSKPESLALAHEIQRATMCSGSR